VLREDQLLASRPSVQNFSGLSVAGKVLHQSRLPRTCLAINPEDFAAATQPIFETCASGLGVLLKFVVIVFFAILVIAGVFVLLKIADCLFIKDPVEGSLVSFVDLPFTASDIRNHKTLEDTMGFRHLPDALCEVTQVYRHGSKRGEVGTPVFDNLCLLLACSFLFDGL
jgi:hypothetical protein